MFRDADGLVGKARPGGAATGFKQISGWLIPRFTRFDTRARAESLAAEGHQFRNAPEVVDCWRHEVLQFLKGLSRAISLADYKLEKAQILRVPTEC